MGSYVYNEENSVENMAPGTYVTLFSQLTNGPSEACYITIGLKGLPGTNTIAYWAHSMKIKHCRIF
jgi:hypothetical protein